MLRPEDVLAFWLDEIGPEGWYAGGEELDERIRALAEPTWQAAMNGSCGLWLTYPSGALAYIILMDQFPRNMFRGTGQAFASDFAARAAAKISIKKDWDLRIDEPARQFFYLPLMHSECLGDQERCVRLMLTRMPETGEENLFHAKAHREVIRMFGRFPYRNDALERQTTAPEGAFLAEGGYSAAMEAVRA
ncbi:hypothetical protein PSA7680_00131 [Pseudoruegeria aquimaris]|uniref:DUF924 domain-containing protein n=1 Tax=Pseudoruegeria aquimaris TaxID=393663 RepID=A0A1Y5R869_9RHOB|nr:DUF924 family protein [Pseudoruegeria aquimaris]SLN11373.1 hypothetical protein PSA7680_00131 [Pseudoruegeria aquimaris]